MHDRHGDWGFGPGFPFGPGWRGPWGGRGKGPRRRSQMFESGEIKFVILRLLKEKPRHGYEVIKALEEQMAGCYTASAGTVYPTLQLLEDEGYIKAVDTAGKKVYHITPEGERLLDENEDVLVDIGERIKEAVRGVAGGAVADVNTAFGLLAKRVFTDAWRSGPDSERTAKIAEILRRATADIEGL